MPGVIVRVLVPVGQAVTRGQDVCILEAMKMQNYLKAPQAGVVRRILVETSQRVSAGQVLLELEPQG
jgi:propionyl-CoA carboxylase alpha chain